MNSILQGLQHVICYFDDILVTGTTEEEHLQYLDTQEAQGKRHVAEKGQVPHLAVLSQLPWAVH